MPISGSLRAAAVRTLCGCWQAPELDSGSEITAALIRRWPAGCERELEQLGLPKEHAEAVCKPYGKEREGLREAAMRSTVRVNGLRDLRWGVTFASDADESRNNASEGRIAIRLTLDTTDEGCMDVDVSEEKFRVLLSELKAVKALMDEDA